MYIDSHPLSDTINLFHYYKKLTERSLSQLNSSQIHTPIKPEISSIAVLMKHLAGNQISRWTHFRSEDGEKWESLSIPPGKTDEYNRKKYKENHPES